MNPAALPPDVNLQAYQRLQLALMLGLRRQISIAVCDNVQLRDRLAERLQKDVEIPRLRPPLVSLELSLENPAFLTQIGQWLKAHPEYQTAKVPPTFQMLGIEGLTRQPASNQQRFLRHLQAIARYLPQLNVNLLLWLSRPWLNTVRQSVPEFWRWRTGVFEFSGEVNVPPTVRGALSVLKQSIQMPERSEQEHFEIALPLSREGDFPLIRLVRSAPPGVREEKARAKEREAVALLVKESERPIEAASVATAVRVAATDGGSNGNSNGNGNGNVNVNSALLPLSLRDIEQLEREQSESPEILAAAYFDLGDRYRDAIAQGATTLETLSTAIQAYERGLQWSDDEFASLPDILNDLGNFYWMRSRHWQDLQPAFADLEQSVQYYRDALERVGEPETAPQQYAKVQNNLGAAYSDLARYGDNTENLQRAIAAYEEAVLYRPRDRDPQKYASTQNNLGAAYWHLAQHKNSAANLRAAIAAYNEALAQYDPATASMQWAMIQNNLGTAYWNLAQHVEPDVFLKKAIDCYQASLQFRTSQAAPAACAATQNNLGTAYWHFSLTDGIDSDQQKDYLHRAISAYSIAISIAEELSQKQPPTFVNFDLVSTYNNLGAVRLQLATNEEFHLPAPLQQEQLEAALKVYLKALSIATLPGDAYEMCFNGIVRAVRIFYQTGGLAAQNRALALIPSQLLPSLLPQL
ncbi:tetratricopeptide repeat protein [Oscillatoria sp. FACHB-1406]|uniref:tetratricopeptide repeat protein n=1 Tax=Oscillatoria sp. FACHB-1406 TaxID=2692846 RepID=UPI0016823ECB|nr:tetratricopeptide repeat protein [Oscillatoria sp. FACHB-1406]MBD2579526.1 tetratricopeptide repeat protein [Oscillatoria sp. FACHB-1406]